MDVGGHRKSIAVAITLGVILITLAVALNVGWVVFTWRAGLKLILGVLVRLIFALDITHDGKGLQPARPVLSRCLFVASRVGDFELLEARLEVLGLHKCLRRVRNSGSIGIGAYDDILSIVLPRSACYIGGERDQRDHMTDAQQAVTHHGAGTFGQLEMALLSKGMPFAHGSGLPESLPAS